MKLVKYSDFDDNSLNEDMRYNTILEDLDLTYLDWKFNHNLPIDEINEGLSDIITSLGNGFQDRMKNYAAGWLLQKMGLPADNNFFSEWAKNIVELISFKHIGDYFGEGSCPYWSKAILKGLEKTIAEMILDGALSTLLNVQINFKDGILGTLAGTVRDTGELALLNTDLNNKLVNMLDGKICGKGTSFTNIFGGGKITPDKLQKATATASTEGNSNPSSILKLLGI